MLVMGSHFAAAQVLSAEAAIAPNLLARHVYTLAHDSLEGRATGSAGELKATRYVAREFERLGLRPGGSSAADGYFQPYTIFQRGWGASFIKTATRTHTLFKDFYVNGLPDVPNPKTLDVVFAGYGIDDARSDYAGLDVRGKAVVVWEGEPRRPDGTYWLTGTGRPSRWSDDPLAWKRKVKAAKDHGAESVLIVSSARGAAFQEETVRRQVFSQRLNRLGLEPITEPGGGAAAYVISSALAQDILGVPIKELDEWQQQSDRTGQSRARATCRSLTVQSPRLDLPLLTRNVLGWVEGSDRPDEVVVVSAHVDHLGKSSAGVIFNGADDNASGVAGVLAIAEAVAQAKMAGVPPRRSVLFVVFTGEELGLLGSGYYVTHPRWPLARTVCNLNLDMVGRTDDAHQSGQAYVYTLGAMRDGGYLQRVNESVADGSLLLDDRFERDDPQDFFRRSDQYNFARNDVPVVQYFTGTHPDYHQPTDDADRIEYERLALIVRQIFRTAVAVANRPDQL